MSWKYSPTVCETSHKLHALYFPSRPKMGSLYRHISINKLLFVLLVVTKICLCIITFDRPIKVLIPLEYGSVRLL